MAKARVRVEIKNYNPHAGRDEREKQFKGMFAKFKKECSEVGILRTLREHENFETRSRKRRRKRRESEIALLKEKLRENFFERK